MKINMWRTVAVALTVVLVGCCGVSFAADGALEQLVDIFEKKGMVSADEARIIRSKIAEDQERLRLKEQELKERERAVQEREKALNAGEETLGTSATDSAKGDNAGSGSGQPDEQAGASTGEGGSPATPEGSAEQGFPMQATFDDGFWVKTTDPDLFSLRIGALLQADYRYYDYDSQGPEKNGFDIRRGRLLIAGKALRYFGYKFEYEFQGAGGRRLLDAYGDVLPRSYFSMRMGQFKIPFGLEAGGEDENIFFAERSMGYYLTPRRDLGFMVYGSVWDDRIYYSAGIYNGDGLDDSTGGDVDAPQIYGRLAVSPFKGIDSQFLNNFHVGGSIGGGDIDRNNVDIHVFTGGLTEFFDVDSSAKFNIIRSVKDQRRYGLDLAWGVGPVALTAEYAKWRFTDIETSSDLFDAEMEDYYVGLLWMITGERPTFKNGRIQAIKPKKSVGRGGWGGLGLALRYDVFQADPSVYDNLIIEGNSVREAKAYTIAMNWYLNPVARFIIDATRTKFDKPLLIDRDSVTGTAIYAKREDVITGRFQLGF